MKKSFLFAMTLLFLIGTAVSQPSDAFVLYGTISTLGHRAPAEECFKMTITFADSTVFVPNFAGYGAEYVVEDCGEIASWVVTISGVTDDPITPGDVIRIHFEDTCILEYLYMIVGIEGEHSQDLGNLRFSDYYGIRSVLNGYPVDPEEGTVDLDYYFSVDYSNAAGRMPALLQVIVDGIAYDVETDFPADDYTRPVNFGVDIAGETFGKGTYFYYYYAEDIGGFPAYSDTFDFEIVNSPPAQPVAHIEPEMPFYDEDLNVVITNLGEDVDGDDVFYEYDWFVNGSFVEEADGAVLENHHFNAWDRIEVIVVPFDGTVYGPDVVLTTTIIAPELLNARVTPLSGERGDEFTYLVTYRNRRNIPAESVQISIDGGDMEDMDMVDPEADAWDEGVEYTFTAIIEEPSEHTFTIIAYDELGHVVATSLSGPVIANEPPTEPTVELIADPEPATVRSTIICLAEGSEDPDGDEVSYLYSWFVNGEALDLDVNTNEIDSEYFGRGDFILCEVTASDGYMHSDPVTSDTLWIVNSKPNPPIVAYRPEEPYEMDDIALYITEEADDPDGDEIEGYDYRWYLGEELMHEGDILPSELTAHSQIWTAEIRSFDGLDYSDPFVLEIAIVSPIFADAYFVPDEGEFSSGDLFTFVAAYYNGREYELETAWVIIDDTDTFEVSPYEAPFEEDDDDGDTLGGLLSYEDGALFAAEVPVFGRGGHYFRFEGLDVFGNFIVDIGAPNVGPVIGNLPPEIDSLFISAIPEDEFSRNGVLVAEVFGSDIDGDELEYVYQWYMDSLEIEGATAQELGNEFFARGDVIWFMARAFDGLAYSEPASSEPVVIGNAAPVVEYFAIMPDFPNTEDDLNIELIFDDLDGDDCSVEFSWLKNGELTDITAGTVPARRTKNYDVWTAIVGIFDGYDWTYDTTDIEIQNTPPEFYAEISDTVAIVGIEYTMTLPIRDRDFDVLTYRLIEGPDGMRVGRHNGRVRWVPDTIGVYEVSIGIADREAEIFANFNVVVICDTTDMLSPTNLRAESGFAGVIPIMWDEPLLFETVSILPIEFVGYEIFRKRASEDSYSSIAIVSGRSYSDASVDPETPYMYKVRAVYNGLVSEFTNEVLASAGSTTATRWFSPFTYLDTPTIDGVFSRGEWSDASFISLGDVDVYLKNTDKMLYIGVVNHADGLLGEDDRLLISIDDNYNRRFPSASPSSEGEYRIEMGADGTVTSFQGIWGVFPHGIGRDPRVETVVTKGAAGFDGEAVVYEIAIPISDAPGRAAEYIKSQTGRLIGLRVEVFNAESYEFNMIWPAGSNAENAGSFGSLFLGEGENFGNIYATPRRQEIYLRSGSIGELPLFIGNNASGNITYNLVESYISFMPDDVLRRSMEPVRTIVYCDDDMLGQQALADLGYSYALYTDAAAFVAALEDEEVNWHLAVVTVEVPSPAVLSALADFNAAGGKVVIAGVSFPSESALWYRLGARPFMNLGNITSAISFDQPGNAIFRFPNPIAGPIDRLEGRLDDFGDAFMAYSDTLTEEATFIASFDRIAYPRNHAIAISADESMILNSFAVKAMDVHHGEDVSNGVKLLANQIYYLAASNDIDWLSFSPEHGNLATHQEHEITVTYNATGMDTGTYNGYIHIYSNDPDEPFIPVECVMHVGVAEPVNVHFAPDTIRTVPGVGFEVPIFVNELAGMGIDMIEFTVSAPAEYISPTAVDIVMGEGIITEMSGNSIRIRLTTEDYFMARGHVATVTFNTDMSAPAGISSFLSIVDVVTNVEDIDIAPTSHKLIRILAGDLDWLVQLVFSSYSEYDTIHFGVTEGATDGYDDEIDEVKVDRPGLNVYFDISEFDSVVTELKRDMRSPDDEFVVWYAITGRNDGKVEWTFRDEDTLSAMGNLLLNGEIDMKTALDYEYTAGETLMITYSLDDSRSFVLNFARGYTMFSVPITNEIGYYDASELLPGNTGVWRFNSTYGIRNWQNADRIYPGVGYVVHFTAERSIEVSGTPVTSVSTSLNSSWNLIGSPFGVLDFSEPVTDPAGAIMGLPYHAYLYNPVTRGYDQTDELRPGRAYFVLAREDCELYLNSGPAKSTPASRQLETAIINVNGSYLEMGFGNRMFPILPDIPGQTYQAESWINADGIRAVSYLVDEADYATFEITVNTDERVEISEVSLPIGWTLTIDGQELPAKFDRAGTFKVLIERSQKPEDIALLSNYPNPFNAQTRVDYTVFEASEVLLAVYDVSGRLIRTLVSDYAEAGSYSVNFDGRNDNGVEIVSGIYFVKIEAGSYSNISRMMLVK